MREHAWKYLGPWDGKSFARGLIFRCDQCGVVVRSQETPITEDGKLYVFGLEHLRMHHPKVDYDLEIVRKVSNA